MNDLLPSKSPLKSLTIWGAVLSIGFQVAQMFGYDLGDPTGATNDIATIVGAGLSIVGRVKASKKIKF